MKTIIILQSILITIFLILYISKHYSNQRLKREIKSFRREIIYLNERIKNLQNPHPPTLEKQSKSSEFIDDSKNNQQSRVISETLKSHTDFPKTIAISKDICKCMKPAPNPSGICNSCRKSVLK
jgi:predicted PurR-regulated permease PerM